MKKLISLLMALVMALSLAACGNKQAEPEGEASIIILPENSTEYEFKEAFLNPADEECIRPSGDAFAFIPAREELEGENPTEEVFSEKGEYDEENIPAFLSNQTYLPEPDHALEAVEYIGEDILSTLEAGTFPDGLMNTYLSVFSPESGALSEIYYISEDESEDLYYQCWRYNEQGNVVEEETAYSGMFPTITDYQYSEERWLRCCVTSTFYEDDNYTAESVTVYNAAGLPVRYYENEWEGPDYFTYYWYDENNNLTAIGHAEEDPADISAETVFTYEGDRCASYVTRYLCKTMEGELDSFEETTGTYRYDNGGVCVGSDWTVKAVYFGALWTDADESNG